jgi:hypothetical protein
VRLVSSEFSLFFWLLAMTLDSLNEEEKYIQYRRYLSQDVFLLGVILQSVQKFGPQADRMGHAASTGMPGATENLSTTHPDGVPL